MLENLRKLREESRVTQKQLAEAIGVSQQSINKYENHNIEPDIETLIRIAEYFYTSVDYLVGQRAGHHEKTGGRSGLSSEEEKLLTFYRKLTPRQRCAVSLVAETYAES